VNRGFNLARSFPTHGRSFRFPAHACRYTSWHAEPPLPFGSLINQAQPLPEAFGLPGSDHDCFVSQLNYVCESGASCGEVQRLVQRLAKTCATSCDPRSGTHHPHARFIEESQQLVVRPIWTAVSHARLEWGPHSRDERYFINFLQQSP
jgi:hypothetical protein